VLVTLGGQRLCEVRDVGLGRVAGRDVAEGLRQLGFPARQQTGLHGQRSLPARTAHTLNSGCFDTGSQLVTVSSLAARPGPPAGPCGAQIPVPIMERNKNHAGPHVAQSSRDHDGTARRFQSHQIAVAYAEPGGIVHIELCPRSGAAASSSGARPVFVRVWKW
jgi:hypothetical protein